MECLHPRCAGVDIAKKSAKVCVRVQGSRRCETTQTVTDWGSTTRQVLGLRDYLVDQHVSCVVMEATGDYWKPYYYLLEDAGFEVQLVNARHVKNLPGRKSDVSDAAWLAQLGAHGLVSASFVPPPPIRQLRDLTRTRSAITRERSREIARLEKLLEDAGIKLSSVASDLTGVSSRRMLRAMVDGQRDPAVLADLALGTLRAKIPALTEALTGRFNDHHAFLTRMHLDLIDTHTAAIAELTARIEVAIKPYAGFRDLISSIPGIAGTVADIVVAETGADMSQFPTAHRLTSWAGVAPGSNQSADVVKQARCRRGDSHLKAALGIAAMSAARTHNTYLGARFARIKNRRGGKRALVAIQRSMLVSIWAIGSTGVCYHDPGADHYTRRRPERERRRALHTLQNLGYQVQLKKAS